MGYPRALDEYKACQLEGELARRQRMADAGQCDYCGRLRDEGQPCRFPDRHAKARTMAEDRVSASQNHTRKAPADLPPPPQPVRAEMEARASRIAARFIRQPATVVEPVTLEQLEEEEGLVWLREPAPHERPKLVEDWFKPFTVGHWAGEVL
jgi:hypothetical protein